MRISYLLLVLLFFLNSCQEDKYTWESLEVTATAYNSLSSQTDGDPFITAFGDSLIPGKRYIAVSRDLISKGLKHNIPVLIEGFDGVFLVKDKMHSRWRNKIDIYMGNDKKLAMEWGRKKVKIKFRVMKDLSADNVER